MGGVLKPGYEVTAEVKLLRRLGAGGMGTVWLARHEKLGSDVVVKFLSESLASDPDACERFAREVKATIKVRSPHVVQILDHGITESGIPYLVMEHLEGQDLGKLLRQRGTLRPDEAMHVIEGLASALTKAHELYIVHRDIKPANVFLCSGSPRPFVKLVDFGIAKRLEDETMTATHALLGTPQYMSPEQMRDTRTIDHRTDLWALGILVHHMLTGSTPFRGAHIAHVVHQIMSEPTPKITARCPDLSAAVDVWLERALDRNPQRRFSSAREMADALALALGDLAYSTTRRMEASGPNALAVIPPGSGPLPRPSSPSGQIPQIAIEGPTLGPSAVTQSPHGSSPRTKWYVMALAALVVVLVGAAFRVGYGLRKEQSSAAAPSAPPPSPPPPPVTAAATASTPMSASATELAPAPPQPPTSAAASASSLPKKPQPPRQRSRPLPHPGEDDIGF